MKNSSVRRPSIGNTSAEGRSSADMSVGDIMRKAKKDLMLKRICYVLLGLIVLAFIVFFIVSGDAAIWVDKFFSLMD